MVINRKSGLAVRTLPTVATLTHPPSGLKAPLEVNVQ